MHGIKVAVILGIAVLITGCVPSIHPFYTPTTTVFDKALVGTWEDKDTPEDTWVFKEASDGKSYDLAYTEQGDVALFEAHLVKIGNHTFLDTYPSALEPGKNTLRVIHFVPAHILFRVKIEGDSLNVRPLDPDWLKKMIEQKKIKIARETVEGDILLTAQTSDLQAFCKKYGAVENAFQKPGCSLQRRKQ